MTLKFCPSCGRNLVTITSRTSESKAVCLDCELTYKVIELTEVGQVIRVSGSSPSQISEAAISRV